MNVVDSSAWLEYLADGPNAEFFAPAIESPSDLVVPSIAVLEVFKSLVRQRSEAEGLQAVSLMQQGQMVELDTHLALSAARLGLVHKLPLADSVILATARSYDATLWTQDADFEGLEGVEFRATVR